MSNRSRSLAVALACSLTALALAGCLGAAGQTEPDTAIAAVAADEVAEPGTVRGVTAFFWGASEPMESAVLRLPIVFSEKSECELLVASSGEAERPGTHAVEVIEYGGGGVSGYMWGAMGSGSWATAYAGPIDTRTLLFPGGGWGSLSGISGELDGEMTVTAIAADLAPVEGSFAPGYSFAFAVACEAPFDIVGAKQGEEAALWSIEGLDGVGADVFLVGSAAAQATGSIDITSDDAGYYVGSFGAQAGVVQLDHPAGSDAWTLPLDSSSYLGGSSLQHGEDGAGTYTLTVTRVGVRFEAFWAAAYGFGGPLDLAGQLAESPIEDPFA